MESAHCAHWQSKIDDQVVTSNYLELMSRKDLGLLAKVPLATIAVGATFVLATRPSSVTHFQNTRLKALL